MSVAALAKDKAIRALIKRAEAVGWHVVATTNGRFKVRPTKGEQFIIAGRTGDPRGVKNIEAVFARAGLSETEAERSAQLAELAQQEEEEMATDAFPTGQEANEHERANHRRTSSAIDDHTLGIIAFGRQLGHLADSLASDNRDLLIAVLRAADSVGLNLAEVVAALEKS